VGRAGIDAIRELTHSYREMDNRLGGGKLRSSVVSYLDEHGLAQRYLTQALAYARHADDPVLAAEVLAA